MSKKTAVARRLSLVCLVAVITSLVPLSAISAPLAAVERNGAYIAIEPHGPNIARVTISLDRKQTEFFSGDGFIDKPNSKGWSHHSDAAGDSFSSGQMTVVVPPQPWPRTPGIMQHYFAPTLPPVAVRVETPDGHLIAAMTGWDMTPVEVAGERTFRVGASFRVMPGEHYYGLGQNQEGILDLKGRTIDCRHNYGAAAGETVCVPFMITNRHYGVVWDNASPTTVSAGVNGNTHWSSEVGERVSFFVITGSTTDALIRGYAALTGPTPLPPKPAFGLIQSKARYETQAQLMAAADGYRKRGYPLDVMVLDWFYWTRIGELDIDRAAFPDPAAMNQSLHDRGVHTLISVWPRFERGSRYFDLLAAKGWLLHDRNGKAVDGPPFRSDPVGGLLDSTNPDAREWYWDRIRDNLASLGFDWFWLDETEPDLSPDGRFYSIGSGDRYHNLFPLVHTSSVADGSARDRPNKRNLILCRAAYLGSQRTGCLFWSSDVQATWEALRRQVPTGLNVAASGLAYWGSDTGGWQWPHGPKALYAPLVNPAGATAMNADYADYPELFVRWFQYNSFTPTLRVHGNRPDTEIWAYGAAAEPILAKFLRLRYALMPYLYSLGYSTSQSGVPFMRALFMDFPEDPQVANLGDEYMFGPAFLVAPVTEQGQTSRRVYLPAGTAWYDWWTNERFAGGQWITAPAPIDRLPLFVRAGAIVPLGVAVSNTGEAQPLSEIRVFPGADGSFSLYDDDGLTNEYRQGLGRSATLRWDDHTGRLSSSGPLPTGQDVGKLLKIVGAPDAK
ncbi:MAG TPA: glycoside hydrolase family 31 protein [Burkholderiaceae bacterium]|jgi:alpha-D-xyloside xylohydrolase